MRGLVLLIALLAGQIAWGVESPWNDGCNAIVKGEIAAAVQIAQKLSQSNKQEDRDLAIFLAGKIMVAKGSPKDAASTVRAYFTEKRLSDSSPVVKVEFAKWLIADNNATDAIILCNEVGKNSDNQLLQANVAEALALAHIHENRYDEAKKWMQKAIEYAISDQGDYKTNEPYIAKLRGDVGALKDQEDLAVHGYGFYLYRMGNEKRQNSEYAKALVYYDALIGLNKTKESNKALIPSGMDLASIDKTVCQIYVAAARLYRAECLIKSGKVDEASQSIDDALQERATPFRGELLRLQADIALKSRGDIKLAAKTYSESIEWLTNIPVSLEIYAVPDKSKIRTAPADKMRFTEGWGNIEWFRPEPQQVYNADTCKWYVGFQLMQAKISRSLCYFLSGDKVRSVTDLSVISEYDEIDDGNTKNGQISNYLRLKDGYECGRLYATQEELTQFKGVDLARVACAEILIETEQWKRAGIEYDQLLQGKGHSWTADQLAYLIFARASIMTYSGDTAGATKLLSDFELKYATTKTAPRVLLLLSSMEAYPQCIKKLEKIASQYPRSQFVCEAIFTIGQYQYVNQAKLDAEITFGEVIKRFPGTEMAASAAVYIDDLNKPQEIRQ